MDFFPVPPPPESPAIYFLLQFYCKTKSVGRIDKATVLLRLDRIFFVEECLWKKKNPAPVSLQSLLVLLAVRNVPTKS